jgi:2',3'-cyclic-nucleotide 2'-phosphodiesterase (5'-nucleotidase family)
MYTQNWKKIGQIIITSIILLLLCNNLIADDSQNQTNNVVEIIYGGDHRGNFHPCHCPSDPLGGISRFQTFVETRRQITQNLIVLYTGNATIGYDSKAKQEAIFASLKLAILDAILLGPTDYAHGADVFDSFQFKLPYTLTNASNLPMQWKSIVIIERAGMKIAIMGIVDPDDFMFFDRESLSGVNFIDYEQIINRQITELRNQVDLIILMSQLSWQDSNKLADSIDGIDVIISKYGPNMTENRVKVGSTYILPGFYEGRKAGRLLLAFSQDGEIVTDLFHVEPLNRSYAESQTVLEIIRAYTQNLGYKEIIDEYYKSMGIE